MYIQIENVPSEFKKDEKKMKLVKQKINSPPKSPLRKKVTKEM